MPRWYEMLLGTFYVVVAVPRWLDLVFGTHPAGQPLAVALLVPMLGWFMVVCFRGLRRTPR